MPSLNTNTVPMPLSREQLMREAILLTFCDPVPARCLQLLRASNRDWQKLLRWLDISGVALYFLDRLTQLRMLGLLPPEVHARLQQNLTDNTQRMQGMMAESIAIQRDFQYTGLTYAVLKGSSFWPRSVPRLELRSQLDLDFLIAEKDVPTGQRILESRGYHLHAVSGRSWEFKTTHIPSSSLNDLYKDLPSRCVELHVEPGSQSHLQLAKLESQSLQGFQMPILSSVDAFLGQGMHLYKHYCSEFSRTAHLLEFRRHVQSRYGDNAFWDELRSVAEGNPRASLDLGVVTLLITHVMGEFAPKSLTSWTVDRLPASVSLWIDTYGRWSVVADFPGNKLYLLLQNEMEHAGVPAKRSLRRALVPLRLPPPISHSSPDDTLALRMRRHHMQIKFILFRLRFHLREGVRYKLESRRWRRRLQQLLERESIGSTSAAPAIEYHTVRSQDSAIQRNDNSLTRT